MSEAPTIIRIASAEVFAAALKKVLPFVAKKSKKPILEYVRLSVPNVGKATLSGTDLEKGARVAVAGVTCERSDAGRLATLPANALRDALKGRTGGLRLAVSHDSGAVVFDNGGHATWTVDQRGDFPEVPPEVKQEDIEGGMTLDCNTFAEALKAAAPFVATGDARYGRNGVYLGAGTEKAADDDKHPPLGKLDVVASDTHRLSRIRMDCLTYHGKIELIITNAATLAGALRGVGGAVGVTVTAHDVVVTAGDDIYFVRRIDGQFPRYTSLIPAIDTAHAPKIVADRRALAAALKVLPKDGQVRLSPANGGDGLRLSYTRDDTEGVNSVPAFSAKMPGQITYTTRYLLEMLSTGDSPEVTFYCPLGHTPGFVQEGSHTHIVMPVGRYGDTAKDVPEATPEDRGAESLEAALDLPDRPVMLENKPKTVRTPAKAPTKLTLESVLSWLSTASPADRNALTQAVTA